MSSSGKTMKSLEKYLTNDKEKSTKKNNNKKIKENKNKIEYNHQNNKNEYFNGRNDLNINVKNQEGNKIKELVNEGIISFKDNDKKGESNSNINNIEYENMNYEKIIKKIIELNRALKFLKIEEHRLKSEKNTFSDAINDNNQNINLPNKNSNFYRNYNYSNDDNLTNRSYLFTKNKDALIKKYEDDLNFFDELMKKLNNDITEL